MQTSNSSEMEMEMNNSNYISMCNQNRDEAIMYAEMNLEGAIETGEKDFIARAEFDLSILRSKSVLDFARYNSCASPKESTELY